MAEDNQKQIICPICENENIPQLDKCEFCGAKLKQDDEFSSFLKGSSPDTDSIESTQKKEDLDPLIGESPIENDVLKYKQLEDDLDSFLEGRSTESQGSESKRKIFREFARRWESKEQGDERKELPRTCGDCGGAIKSPFYKCIDCGLYYGKEDIKGDEDDINTCPACDSLIIRTPRDEVNEILNTKKCLECNNSHQKENGPGKAAPSTYGEEDFSSDPLQDLDFESLQVEEEEQLICPECGTSVDPKKTNCPSCGMSFMDFGLQPEIRLEHSVQEEVEEEAEYECPVCSGPVYDNDIKCQSCGIEFLEMDEQPDEFIERSISDLERFIEDTVSEFEFEGKEDDDFLSIISDLEEVEEGKDARSQISASPQMEAGSLDSEDFLDSYLDQLKSMDKKEDHTEFRSKRSIGSVQCPICHSPTPQANKFCTQCGMLSLTKFTDSENQINGFISDVKNLIDEQNALNRQGDILRKLQLLDLEIRKDLDNDELWFKRGMLLVETGSFEKALKSMDTVLKLNPQHKKVWIAKANILGRNDKIEQAAKCYQKAFELIKADYPEPKQIKKSLKRPQSPEKLRPEMGLTNGIKTKKMGLSRGLTNGLTNGLTRKKRGMVNGLTNGKTNGLHRSKRGMVNGLTNGKINGIKRRKPGMVNGLTNGKINGISRRKLGMVNGLTNDKINGLSRSKKGIINGFTNGKVNGINKARLGMINGLTNGLTNGITNGLTNGLTRGMRALKFGITNGLTNGNGITNGIGGEHALLKERSSKGRIVTVAVLIVLIIIVPYFILATHTGETGIEIDGRFGDWGGVNNNLDSQDAAPFNPNVDIVDFWIDDRFLELSFYLRVEGRMLAGEPGGSKHVDTAYIFIDSDIDPETGFLVKGMGADYLLEIYGWNAKIVKSSIHMYTSEEQDWNLWEEMGGVKTKVTDSELETQVHFSNINITDNDPVDILFYMQSWDGFDDFADTIISNKKGVLSVTQKGVAPDVITDHDNRLLQIELEAFDRNINVLEIEAKRTGEGSDNDVTNIRLEDENGNAISHGELIDKTFSFSPDLQVNKGASVTLYVVVDVKTNARLGDTIGLKIQNKHDIITDFGTVHLNRKKPDAGLYDNAYIGVIPGNISIDGAFSDWVGRSMKNDTQKEIRRPDLDIHQYGVSTTSSGPAFYLSVDNEIAGGLVVPYWNNLTFPTLSNSTGGVGGKGHEPPPKTGEDYVYIFIDSQSNYGYSGDIPITADHMIEIIGRHNEIISSTFYEWSGFYGSHWDWKKMGSADAALDMIRMEVAVNWEDLNLDPITDTFNIYFMATDWEKHIKDYSDGDGTLLGPRGTRAASLQELLNGIGNSGDDNFGWNVSYAGDVNNDGYPDIVVGAPFNDTTNGANPNWWDTEWSHRKKLTFDNSAQTEDLENFPVLVKLSSSNFDYSNAKSDGTDLRFLDPDGTTEMKYHIEKWDTSGSSYVWVNVTSIDGASSTDYMYMYYGNSSASDVQDISGSYDGNFSGVWHLNETSGTLYDATSNDLDGTQAGGVTYGATGRIDGSVKFDGGDDEVYISDNNELDPPNDMTIETWVKLDVLSSTLGSAQNIVYREHSLSPWLSFELAIDTSDNFYITWVNSGGTENYAGYTGTVSADTWYYLVGVRDGTTLRFYLNGGTTDCYIDSTATGTLQNADREFHLGDDDGPDPLNGTLDEVRLSDKARSADWVAAQYLSMTDGFITYGEEDPIWWNTNWQYRRRITFNNSDQTETLYNFTTLVTLTTSNFGYSNFNSDGSDIRFLDADGSTEYNYHYEDWNTSGNSYIWVNVTEISGSSSTDYMYMYYGYTSAPDVQDIEGTYDSNFSAVWHLNETSGTHYDATSNNNDGTQQNGVTQDYTGYIDGGDYFDGSNQEYVTASDDSSLNPSGDITVGAWVYFDDLSSTTGYRQNILFKLDTADSPWWDYSLYLDTNDFLYFGWTTSGGTSKWSWYTGSLSADTWYYVVGQRDGTDMKFYVNGDTTDTGGDTGATGSINDGTGGIRLGSEWDKYYINGTMDEIRIHDTARSADWVAAQYLSMTDDFVTMDSEEASGSAGAAYIFFGYSGISSNDINASNANVSIYGSNYGDEFGWDVRDAQNVNGDSYDDIIIGAPGYGNDKGRAYIFYGRATGSWSSVDDADADADVIITGEADYDRFGQSVSGTGNYDNSGNDDLIVGAPNANGFWDTSWNYRKKLTFINGDQTENFENFPVLVNLSSSIFDYSKAKADGTDLRFIDSDGSTELDYHIEDWDSSGYSYIWVEVPQIDGSSSTDYIWMYYNNSAASDVRDVEGTWDSNFTAVWHLNETSGDIYDATSNNHDGTKQGGITQDTSGVVDGADDFDGDADYYVVSTTSALNITAQITIEAWTKPDGIDHTDVDLCIVSKFDSSDMAYQLGINDDAGDSDDWDWRLSSDGSSADGQIHVSNAVDNNEWQYIVGTWDGSTMRLYKNAEEIGTSVSWSGPIYQSAADAWIGDGTYYGSMDGWLDEVRISNKGRSADWITAQYLSMTDDFVTYGSEESQSIAEGFGRAYIFLGDGSIPTTAAGADKNYTGENIGDQFGFAVSDAGDVDNNGNDDVIIGAPFNDDSGTDAGKVYIYFYDESYAYVSTNLTTYGVIIDFNNAKSALDSGSYAILKESNSGGSGGNEYLYVDGFGSERVDWTESGSSPYLDAVDGSNTISDNTVNDEEGDFTFNDTSVVGSFSSSQIELYSMQAGSGETIDVYIHDGSSWNYMGSITPDASYSWKSIDTSSVLDTAAKIDAAKLYVVYQKSGAGSTVTVDASRIYWSATSNVLYQMDIEFNTTSVSSGSSYELQLNYSVDGSETDFGVLVYDGSSWDDLSAQGDLTSTSFALKNYTLNSEHILGSSYARVRFIGRNETSDTVNSTLNIEYHRIKSTDPYVELTGEGAGDNFGYSVSNVSDINSDGTYDDVMVGAPFTADDWWNDSWQYRQKLTFNNGLQRETLQNFPVLINLSSSNFDYSNAKSDGTDLRFIDPDGSNEFNYHIESWNSSSYSYVWVNVTSIDGGSTTDNMWMYYGNSDAADVQDITGTYDINYTGVWHLNESSGTPYDATQYDNDGTLYNSVTQGITGQVDGAYDFAGSSGTDDYIDCGNDPSLYFDVNRNYTWSAWIYRHGNADWDVIFSKFSWTTSGLRVLVDSGSPAHIGVGDHNNVLVEGTTAINLNTWYYVVMTFNSSSPSVPNIYLNGKEEITTGSTTFFSDSATQFDIGYGNSLEDFDGLIDEVKVSNKLRSADWIAAQYKSMTNTFITFGGEEDYSPGKAYIYYGGPSMGTTADVNLTGDSSGDRFGYSVDFAGDVDNDGTVDAIVGAPYHDDGATSDCGIVYVQKGGSSMSDTARYIFKGSQSGEHLGWSVSFALKINGSSTNSAVFAGSPDYDDGSDSDAGKSYILCIETYNIVINEIQFDPRGGPYDEYWNYRKKITIHSSQVAGNLTDFPVLINTIDTDLKDKAQSDGDDIIFVGADNDTKYDHEIEKYDSSTGELIAWVKIPYLSSINDTVFYMYYNNSEASNQENEEGVWSNGYVAVYHMIEESGSIGNSASTTNDGTRGNTPTRDTGQIGYAQNFTGGGADDYFNLGDLGLADGINQNLTISTWANINNAGVEDWGKIVAKRNNSDTGYVYMFSFNDNVTSKELYIYINEDGSSGQPIVKSNWTYLSFTYDGSSQLLYYNGTLILEDTGMSGAIWESTADVSVGARINPTSMNMGGILDELRFSNVPRSQSWIETEFKNQYLPGTFYTINGEDINTSAWTFRKKILINSEKVSGDIDGFPMMIKTTDSDLASFAQPDGDDIIFTDWDGKSQLNHEVESYNSTTGELIAWVRMPSLSSSVDTTIYMYYNNSDATNSQDDEAVFSNGYVGVYHMDEESGSISNSASSTDDGAREGTPTRTAGSIGYGQEFTGDGENDLFNLTDMGLTNGVLENMTISFWMKANENATSNWGRIVCKRNDSNSETLWGVYFNDGTPWKDLVFRAGDETGSEPVGNDTWIYVTMTYDGTTKIHYRNGSFVRDDTGGSGPLSEIESSAPVTIGARQDGGQEYAGILDEVRISRITLSADWILTEFNNQYSPGSFYTFNDENVTITNWNYVKSITINSSEVEEDLFAFPILVDITDSDLASDARSDGYDIIFTDSTNESKLCHEIENYTSASGDLVAWVKIPRLSSSTDTKIYMYYGDSSIGSPTENTPGVWENDYLGVWHLNEVGNGTADEYDESSVYNYSGQGGSGTSSKVPQRISGKIDSGQLFDGFEDHINVSSMNPKSYDDFTIEAWYKSTNTSVSDDEYFFNHVEEYMQGPGFLLGVTEDNPEIKNRMRLILYNNTNKYRSYYGTTNITDQQFHYVVGLRDDESIRLYVDKAEENNTNDRFDGIIINVDSGLGPIIGDLPGETEQTDGILDEIRLSGASRSWAWINATYDNINDTASFLYTGSEGTPSSSTSDSSSYYEWVELYNPGSSAVDLDGWTLNDNDGNTFNLSGAGSIASGGYLVCHFGQSGTNSTTNVYGAITATRGTTLTMLENSDDLMLVDDYDIIIDYVVWGADAGSDDDVPSAWGQWTDGNYVDTSDLSENETIGRDQDSTDTDLPADWEDASYKADPYGVNATSATQGARNWDGVVIPEFSEGMIPVVGLIIIFITFSRRSKNKYIWKRKKT